MRAVFRLRALEAAQGIRPEPALVAGRQNLIHQGDHFLFVFLQRAGDGQIVRSMRADEFQITIVMFSKIIFISARVSNGSSS